jgi:hypothetical protein
MEEKPANPTIQVIVMSLASKLVFLRPVAGLGGAGVGGCGEGRGGVGGS